MFGFSKASSQGLRGEGGHHVPLRCRCVRRRRESLAPFARVMLRSASDTKAGETVRAGLRRCASGERRRAPRRRRGFVRTNTARGGPARGRQHRAPKGHPCDGGRTVGCRPASVHAARKQVHARSTPPNAPSACPGGRATAWAPPLLAGTSARDVERERGHCEKSPHTLPRMAGDRLSAPSDFSRREAPAGGLTDASSARLTNGCVAHARDEARPGPPSPQKKTAPAGHVQGTWWMSS